MYIKLACTLQRRDSREGSGESSRGDAGVWWRVQE